jgi:hypothetical protein
LPHARAVLEAWRRDYSEERPHSKLGWMTPRAYAGAILKTPAEALRNLTAPRFGLLKPPSTMAQITTGLSLPLDEKGGARHHHEAWKRGKAAAAAYQA